METFISTFKEAHREVMEQTGMGEVLSKLGLLLSDGPDILDSLKLEVRRFLFAVNWREPFFAYLAVFLLFTLVMVLYLVLVRWQPIRPRPAGVTRAMELAACRAEEKLFALSMVLLGMAFASYPLNRLGVKYGHRLFVEPKVNYFDESAIFIGTVLWLPMVLLALFVQGKMVFNVVRLMVYAKREQFALQQRSQETTGKPETVRGQAAAKDATGKKKD